MPSLVISMTKVMNYDLKGVAKNNFNFKARHKMVEKKKYHIESMNFEIIWSHQIGL